MNIDTLPSYLISLSSDRIKTNFYAAHKPCIFSGIKGKGITRKHAASIGCFKAHFKLWETLVASYDKNQYILIFEDDAALCRDMTEEHKQTINTFMNEINGNILLLGYNPSCNNLHKTEYKNLKYGHTLDTHAYIIKVEFADYFHKKYFKQMNSYTHQILFPTGSIDTLFLRYKVYVLYPMLFIQKNDKRYDSILLHEGYNNKTNHLLYGFVKTVNDLHYNKKLLPIIVISIIIFIVIIILFYIKSKNKYIHG